MEDDIVLRSPQINIQQGGNVFALRLDALTSRTLELVQFPGGDQPVDTRPVRRFHPRWMYCRVENRAEEPLFVYGPRHLSDTTTIPTSLFVLHPGQSTPGHWDCKGILIPSDRSAVNGTSVIHGPVAFKYRDMRRVKVTTADGRYQCPRCNGVLSAGQIDFEIPTAPYRELLCLPRRLVEL